MELASAFLRARDRLDGGFEDAPPDGELTERQRVIWDIYTEGRLYRQGGYLVNEPRRRYTYRLRCGFNDVADAEYERLWAVAPRSPGPSSRRSRSASSPPTRGRRIKKPLRNETLRILTRPVPGRLLEVVGGDRLVEVEVGRARPAAVWPRWPCRP